MANHKRKLRNYLLDPSLQITFAVYSVAVAVLVAGLVGTFLFRTTRTLFSEMDIAVQARSKAADTSKELGNAALSAELLQHFEDPSFEAELKKKSKSIDDSYEAEKNAIVQQKKDIEAKQRLFNIGLFLALIAFAFLTGFASIVLTHRVAGPLLRVRRILNEIGEGKYDPPAYGLRDGDELREMFDDATKAVTALKVRRDEAIAMSKALVAAAQESNVPADLRLRIEAFAKKVETV